MRPIPKKQRERLASDPYMKKCCITGNLNVEWHHNLIFASKQVNEWWAILPLSKEVHDQARNKEVKEKLDWIMLNRAGDLIIPYSKVINYPRLREQLNAKYGIYRITG